MNKTKKIFRWLAGLLIAIMLVNGVDIISSSAGNNDSQVTYDMYTVAKVGSTGIRFTNKAAYQEYLAKVNAEIDKLKAQGYTVVKNGYKTEAVETGTNTIYTDNDSNGKYLLDGEEWHFTGKKGTSLP